MSKITVQLFILYFVLFNSRYQSIDFYVRGKVETRVRIIKFKLVPPGKREKCKFIGLRDSFNCKIIRLGKKKRRTVQFIFISLFFSCPHYISSGDNYRERGLVNRIASRAQYFLACRGRFKPFRSAMNERATSRGKCLRVLASSPAATPRFFAYAYCDRPDSFLRRPFFPLPHPLFFFFFFFFYSPSLLSRGTATWTTSFRSRARESAVGRRTTVRS